MIKHTDDVGRQLAPTVVLAKALQAILEASLRDH
jgi:hypothetical protein